MHFSPILAPQAMHIPDGFLSLLVSALFWLVSLIVLRIALNKTAGLPLGKRLPLMGVLGAAIFAGQMLNFSVTGGTSGHLLGAAIAAILVGPWSAVLVMTAVVSLQALLFQDGGLLALGANIFNMAIVGVFVSYALYRTLARLFIGKKWGEIAAGFAAAWGSIFVASLACALELAASGTSPASLAVPAMAGIHALIGIGEGLITVGALSLILSTRRDLILARGETRIDRGVLAAGGSLALALVVLSPMASGHPDGLEWVAEQHGFLENAKDALYNIFPDYTMPGISDPALSTIAAGVVGVLILLGAAYWARRIDAGSLTPGVGKR